MKEEGGRRDNERRREGWEEGGTEEGEGMTGEGGGRSIPPRSCK
jgi:hypothetical protein